MNQALDILIFLLDVYQWVLLAVVLLSWINPDPYNPVVKFLRAVTDPVLLPFRRLLMPLTRKIMIDFSPILAFLLIGLLQNVLRRIQYGGLNLESLALGVIDGFIIFVAAIALFLFILFVARVIIEATNADRFNPIVRFVYMATDPIVYQVFRRARVQRGRFDPRPAAAAVAMLAVYFLLQSLRTMLP